MSKKKPIEVTIYRTPDNRYFWSFADNAFAIAEGTTTYSTPGNCRRGFREQVAAKYAGMRKGYIFINKF